jgi:hypothetical protein
MSDDFLTGLQRRDASIQGLEFKLPVVISEGRIFSAMFPASVRELCRLLPGESPAPAQLLPGMGLVQLTAYEYSDSDLGPFNEFSVVIPLYTPYYKKIPLYNLLRARTTREVHNFLLHRAATSETAVSILRDWHRWPEFLASIEIGEDGEWLTCEWKEEGELICRMRGRKIPAQRTDRIRVFIYTPGYPQAQLADINPRQSVTVHRSSDIELALGSSHPIARELSGVLRSTRARMYTYGPSWQLIAHGPEKSNR